MPASLPLQFEKIIAKQLSKSVGKNFKQFLNAKISTKTTHYHLTMDRLDCIDNLDRKILSIVMHNARIPSKDVAQVCGVSRAAIHQRIQRMTELGIITGSGYNVNPKLLGYSTCTYIGVNLERGAMYSTVVPELEKIPEVIECHFTTGPYTMLIKLFVRDNEHLMELLNKKIQMIPGVTGTETLISLDNSIYRQIPMYIDEK